MPLYIALAPCWMMRLAILSIVGLCIQPILPSFPWSHRACNERNESSSFPGPEQLTVLPQPFLERVFPSIAWCGISRALGQVRLLSLLFAQAALGLLEIAVG